VCDAPGVLSKIRRFRRYLAWYGPRHTSVAVLRLVRGFFYKDSRLIVLVKNLESINRPKHPGELRVQDMRPEHLPELAELNRRCGRPDLQRTFDRYANHGFHGFVAHVGEELVGYYWWVDRDVPRRCTDLHTLGLGIELEPTDVYGSHFFLLEEHRGGGAAGEFLYAVESSLRERGFNRLWGYVASGNRPARWLYSTRGYEPMWIVRLRRILFAQRPIRESL
jgi:GNAT superfamily N-acetyltransferase